jgi:hypothetical protein
MTKIRSHVHNPDDPKAMSERLTDAGRALDATTQFGGVYFGHPANPFEEDDTTLAGSSATAHNGLIENVRGSWVELEFSALDTAVEAIHNLSIPVINANKPNVRWIVMGVQHAGTQGTRFSDLQVQLGAIRIGPATAATFGFQAGADSEPLKTQIPLLWFSQGDSAYFQLQLPDSWADATAIEPHIHWTTDIAAVADEAVEWGISYSWGNAGAVMPTVSSIYNDATNGEATATEQGTRLVGSTHYTSILDDDGTGNAATISPTGKAHDSCLIAHLFRGSGAPDDYAGEAGLMELDFHIEHDKIGGDSLGGESAGMETWNQNVNVMFNTADTVSADKIELRLHASDFLKVDGSNKVKVTLFFIPAVR